MGSIPPDLFDLAARSGETNFQYEDCPSLANLAERIQDAMDKGDFERAEDLNDQYLKFIRIKVDDDCRILRAMERDLRKRIISNNDYARAGSDKLDPEHALRNNQLPDDAHHRRTVRHPLDTVQMSDETSTRRGYDIQIENFVSVNSSCYLYIKYDPSLSFDPSKSGNSDVKRALEEGQRSERVPIQLLCRFIRIMYNAVGLAICDFKPKGGGKFEIHHASALGGREGLRSLLSGLISTVKPEYGKDFPELTISVPGVELTKQDTEDLDSIGFKALRDNFIHRGGDQSTRKPIPATPSQPAAAQRV